MTAIGQRADLVKTARTLQFNRYGDLMKTLIFALAMTVSAQVLAADGAIYSPEAEAKLGKVGFGLVYKNGKALLRKERPCSLLRADFATEAFERDVLVIGYTGKAIEHNNMGFSPRGQYVKDQVFTEAGVYYDSATEEIRTQIPGGVRYEVCYGKSSTAFAEKCSPTNFLARTTIEITKKSVVMTAEDRLRDGSTETFKTTCEY